MSFNQRLSNIKISRKLSVGFGLVLFLVAVASVLSVLRFQEIRDVYQKTNLMYNINIEVFQAKINRLKYFYGDDKSGQVMSDYVRHASELTASADNMSWSTNEKQIINDVADHLAKFQSSIGEMQKRPVIFTPFAMRSINSLLKISPPATPRSCVRRLPIRA